MRHPWHSFANDLYQHALVSASVEFAVEYLLPGAEIEISIAQRDDDLAAHDLALDMRVRIVFAGIVMAVLRNRRVRNESFENFFCSPGAGRIRHH